VLEKDNSQDVVEESRRNKTEELFSNRYLLVLAPSGRCKLAVDATRNEESLCEWRGQ